MTQNDILRLNGLRNSKPVLQLHYHTGSVLNNFSSIHEAARQTGVSRNGISNCANGKSPYSGMYRWKFINAGNAESNNRAVEQLDPYSAKVLFSYDSLTDAQRYSKIDRSNIRLAANGTYKFAGLYSWRWKAE